MSFILQLSVDWQMKITQKREPSKHSLNLYSFVASTLSFDFILTLLFAQWKCAAAQK